MRWLTITLVSACITLAAPAFAVPCPPSKTLTASTAKPAAKTRVAKHIAPAKSKAAAANTTKRTGKAVKPTGPKAPKPRTDDKPTALPVNATHAMA